MRPPPHHLAPTEWSVDVFMLTCHRHTDTDTHRKTDTQTHRHTDTQPHRHTDTVM
jgi:hypothetical protein